MNDLDVFITVLLLISSLIHWTIHLYYPEEDKTLRKMGYRFILSCICAAYFYLGVLIYQAMGM